MDSGRRKPKVAIVHDWLNTRGGAERVAVALQKAFPDAPIYTSIYEPSLFPELEDVTVHTTWLQRLPRPIRRLHKLFPVLRVWAFRSLDLSDYDIIISSSSAESKQVKKRQDAIHICYCHTPIRYYWNMYDEYRKNPPFGKLNPIIKPIIPPFVRWMRRLDYKAAQNVDYFIANSNEVKSRIEQYYNKDSIVIHPPVDTARFANLPKLEQREGYIALGRQEPYKRIDLAVMACTKLNLPLTVYGRGSEHA
ncbi:glycosyltransferase family 4 protein, partial [Candidatus Saccharibacteria bacterium]